MATVATTVLAIGSTSLAQVYGAYLPVGPAPITAYYGPAPMTYGPVVATSYYAPYAVRYAAPVPYYAAAPVVTPYYAAVPVATPYYVASPVAVPAPLYYGRPVVIHPKVYVRGEPVRNVLRAVTP